MSAYGPRRSPKAVAAWYDGKTQDLLRKYGPGPRVHYHTGVVEDARAIPREPEALRAWLLAAQERLLEIAAAVWRADDHLSGNVLDVGCGLGGGAIYWAQQHGAHVVAVTNVSSHARLVAGFARSAGVGDRIVPVVGDALAVPTDRAFDAVIAIESACYLPRARWMRHVAQLLRPEGQLFVSDVFVCNDEVRRAFDEDWMTRAGTSAEYCAAATSAGLEVVSIHDLTEQTRDYWRLSIAYHRAIAATQPHHAAQAARSIERHDRLLTAWSNGGLACKLLAFRRPA